jgi:hypothetical protein
MPEGFSAIAVDAFNETYTNRSYPEPKDNI